MTALSQHYFFVLLVCAFAQVSVYGNQPSTEPMVAFICGKPAMHRQANQWKSDPHTKQCWTDKKSILSYCQKMYPDDNITNVVEASYLVTIAGWPSLRGNTLHTHRVRPFRCIVDNFQSDALLVPQHCKFDHQHDQRVCQDFDHWEQAARNACAADGAGMHCESFGMLLNCGLGTFSGVEYVCCPNQVPTRVHPIIEPVEGGDNSNDDDSMEDSSEDFDDDEEDDDEDDIYDEEDEDEEEDDEEDDDEEEDDEEEDSWESDEDEEEEDDEEDEEDDVEEDDEDDDDDDEEVSVDQDGNLYELYLKGEAMPSRLANEHQKFVAARQHMAKLQEAKNTQLMKEWTAARDHVNQVRKSDPQTAEKLSQEITDRFQRLYSAYEQEDVAEKQQIVALHQQHVQSELNQRKTVAMDKYLRALEKGDVMRISKNLRGYVKAEEKDVMHTVNHFTHLKATALGEAVRIHARVIQHLKMCQQRIEEAVAKLSAFPDIERQVQPHIEEFMRKFDDLADRIRNEVLPDPASSNIDGDHDDSAEEKENSNNNQDSNNSAGPQSHMDSNNNNNNDNDNNVEDDHEDMMERISTEMDLTDDISDSLEDSHESSMMRDDEDNSNNLVHHYPRPAHQTNNEMRVHQQGLNSRTASTAQLGTTFALAIGSVAVFVVLVVAVVMMRRRSQPRTNVTHGYVEVDPAASPEERHVANMQMNGYENPTYRYFEVQTTK